MLYAQPTGLVQEVCKQVKITVIQIDINLMNNRKIQNNILKCLLQVKIEYIISRQRFKMPEISRFYGIVIKMFFKPKEHEPSHIHALYGECVGVFDLKTHEMTNGDLPLKAQNLVKEWLNIHDQELQKMWDTQTIVKLAPLE